MVALFGDICHGCILDQRPRDIDPGRDTYESKDGNCKSPTLDLSTRGDKKADHKKEDKERYNGNGDNKTTPSLESRKKRRLSTVKKKSVLKRYVKRRRCSLPNQDEVVGSQGRCGMRICILESEWSV